MHVNYEISVVSNGLGGTFFLPSLVAVAPGGLRSPFSMGPEAFSGAVAMRGRCGLRCLRVCALAVIPPLPLAAALLQCQRSVLASDVIASCDAMAPDVASAEEPLLEGSCTRLCLFTQLCDYALSSPIQPSRP